MSIQYIDIPARFVASLIQFTRAADALPRILRERRKRERRGIDRRTGERRNKTHFRCFERRHAQRRTVERRRGDRRSRLAAVPA